jgi:1-acyl-sn-glycerol-3-phosphate acyltransferase
VDHVGSQLSGVPIPDAWSPRFARFFGWYAWRQLRGRFHAVRMLQGSHAALHDLASHRGPALVAMNHSSWWDPMVAVALHHRFFPERGNLSPMDARELNRFRFLRRLGIFGIDPDDPVSLAAMSAHVLRRLGQMERGTLIITPQGRFTDVRRPVVPRPGLASIAASLGHVRAWSVALEYGFWVDARPEIFVSVQAIGTPDDPRRAGWQRTFRHGMQSNQDALAEAVASRDPSGFMAIEGGSRASVHPVYDWWLRMRGKSAGIAIGHRGRD